MSPPVRKRSMFDESSDEESSDDMHSPTKIIKVKNDTDVKLNSDVKSLEPSSAKLSKNEDKAADGPSGYDASLVNVPSEEPKVVLTPAMRARIEHNRQKALMIRREKMNKTLPPLKKSELMAQEGKKVIRINDVKLLDSGGGFFIEEGEEKKKKETKEELQERLKEAEEPAPLSEEQRPSCNECNRKFNSSFLMKHFDYPTCDDCRDNDDKHALLTKTDVRNEYLLQDVDLDKREPPLRYILRRNPHNERWGDMKLYLKLQVEKRCLDVWKTEEALEEAIALKTEKREVMKQKKFKKKMQELRMNVRSSLYTRATKSHEHEYGEEEYIEEDDEYSKTCLTCGHSYRYDKL